MPLPLRDRLIEMDYVPADSDVVGIALTWFAAAGVYNVDDVRADVGCGAPHAAFHFRFGPFAD